MLHSCVCYNGFPRSAQQRGGTLVSVFFMASFWILHPLHFARPLSLPYCNRVPAFTNAAVLCTAADTHSIYADLWHLSAMVDPGSARQRYACVCVVSFIFSRLPFGPRAKHLSRTRLCHSSALLLLLLYSPVFSVAPSTSQSSQNGPTSTSYHRNAWRWW